MLSVLFFHAGLGVPGGFVGVDVFFVISGFVITRLLGAELREGRFSIARFYERRIRRLFPAFFAVLLVSTVLAGLLFMPPEFALYGRSMALAAVFVSNIGFWDEAGYFDADARFKPLLHTWSLGVEEQYYLVFPLLLLGLHRLAAGRRPWILAALVVGSFLLSLRWMQSAPDSAFYLLPARAWELGIGSLLALRSEKLCARPWQAAGLGLAGLALLLAALFGLSESTPFPGVAAVLPCLGTALLIAAGGTPNGVSRMLSVRPLVGIGLVSYSLYLWHWPVIVFLQQRLGHDLRPAEALPAMAISFALAALSWRFVEQPVRRGRWPAARGPMFAAAAAMTALAGATGILIVRLDGVPGRLPARVQAVLAPKADRSPFFQADCFSDNQTLAAGRPIAGPDLGCPIGDPGSSSVSFAVWGDSHAAALAPAVDAAATQSRRSGLFLGRGGCPPLLDYDNTSSHAIRREACREHNAAAFAAIARRQVPLVFLIARWPREVLGGENGNEGPFYDPAAPAPTADRSAQVGAALDATLTRLTTPGRRVVLVMDVPEPGYDVPLALARAAWQGIEARVNPARRAVEARQRLARQVLLTAAARHGALIIDPLPAFCDDALCHVERRGVSRYVDADHLTRRAARELAPLFEGAFEAPESTAADIAPLASTAGRRARGALSLTHSPPAVGR